MIREDLRAYANGRGLGAKIAIILSNPCFQSVALYRASSLFCRCHLSVLSKVVWYVNRVLYGVDIDYHAKIGPGFRIVHGLGIVVGRNVRAGRNLTMYHKVTLGGMPGDAFREDEDGVPFDQPRIGDNVTIFTGANVFGPVVIGDGQVVKACKIVTRDIPDETQSVYSPKTFCE